MLFFIFIICARSMTVLISATSIILQIYLQSPANIGYALNLFSINKSALTYFYSFKKIKVLYVTGYRHSEHKYF